MSIQLSYGPILLSKFGSGTVLKSLFLKGVFVSFILEGKKEKEKGFKSKRESILLFKPLPFPSLPPIPIQNQNPQTHPKCKC